MQQYTVANETGLILPGSDAPHAVGEVLTLDENDANTVEWLASGVITLNATQPEALATPVAPAPVNAPVVAPFEVAVTFDPNASTDDVAAAQSWVAEVNAGLNAIDSGVPACVTAFTVTRTATN